MVCVRRFSTEAGAVTGQSACSEPATFDRGVHATRGGQTYFYHLNARGDVVALSDESGAIVNTYSYDPWGAPLSVHESVPNPCRYASCRYDAATGLYWCWNRYYAPELARFLTRDIWPGELPGPVSMNPHLVIRAE